MKRHALRIAACAWTAALLMPALAHAAPSARLVYARGPGAEACPDEGALRQAVAARVGYDPFFPWAPLTVSVEVTAERGPLRGRIVFESGGIEKGSQTVEEPPREGGKRAACEELLVSIALAVAVALDHEEPSPPPASQPETPATQEVSAPPPAPAASSPPPAAPPAKLAGLAPSSARKVSLWVAAGPRFSLGAWSHVAVAPDVFAELRSGAFGLGVEGRYDFPVTVDVPPDGQASVGRWTGSLLPCLHIRWFVPCGIATFGDTVAQGGSNVMGPTTISAPYAAFGARLGVDLPLVPRLHLLGGVDFVGIATPYRVGVAGSSTQSGPVEGSIGASLSVSIF